MVNPEEIQDMKIQDYRPQTAEVHIKEIILKSPDSCIFPYIEKPQIPKLKMLPLGLKFSMLQM